MGGMGQRVQLPENHFPTAGAVAQGDIVGRREAIESLSLRLLAGQHSYLAGPRRIGKSSIAEAALRRAHDEAGAIPIVIDMLYLTTAISFASAVFDAVAKARGGAGGLVDELRQKRRLLDVEQTYKAKLGPFFEAAIKLTQAAGEADVLLRHAFALLGQLAIDQSQRVVVLLDEFQVSDRIHPDFDEIARHYVADRDQRVTYIFSGSRASMLKRKFGTERKPLFRAALEVALPDPSPEDWQPYLERKLLEVGIQADGACLRKLLEETGGHAQDTMFLASELHLLMFARQSHFAGYPEAEEATGRALRGLDNAFSQEWVALDRSEQIVVARIAMGEKVYAQLTKADNESVRQALIRLQEDGVLSKRRAGDYRLREPLFASYLRKTITSV